MHLVILIFFNDSPDNDFCGCICQPLRTTVLSVVHVITHILQVFLGIIFNFADAN